ncbi:tRNA pseudouridine(13) synthase TruD [Candidatus Micrarchaeota archaeon]|nr:tRNA pseudouridine(13) synthase TruD [Candidatus Micrarchaeota archaeon]
MQSLSHLSKTPGIGGTIKAEPEDFIVEEIGTDGIAFGIDGRVERDGEAGDYAHFILQKRDWTTEGAIRRVAKELRISPRRFNYAGNKDKIAVSTQLVSAFKVEPGKLLSLDLKDIRIDGAWAAADKVRLGGLLGNRFTIKVKDAEDGGTVARVYAELNGKFPNYFGEQRFGTSRKNTHIVGEWLLRGRADKAVLTYLCDSEGEINEDAKLARGHLADSMDFPAALKEFPAFLKLERSMLAHLAKIPNDYAGALRRLPRATLLMFIHAFQSYIFNRLLSGRIAEGELHMEDGEYFCGENPYGFPDISKRDAHGWLVGKLIGYESELNEPEKALIEELDIRKNDFKIRAFPELSSKGNFRTLLAPLKDFSFEKDTFRFSLPAGSYATVALREFLDVKKA